MVFDAVTKGIPYQIRMVWLHTTNLSNCIGAEPDKWVDGLKENVYFTFATDLFMTPTVQQTCDLILPVALSPEHNSVTFPHYGMTNISIRATNKAIEPYGECKDDKQICCDLGQILDVDVFKGRYRTTEDWIYYKRLYARQSFESLAKNVYEKPGYDYRKFEKGLLRGDRQVGFTTASGRVELYSSMFEMSGEEPLPYYKEPKYSPVSDPEYAKRYPFVLTSGARETVYFHSEGRQIPRLREITPNPLVEINPDDAAARGITDGQWVEVFNHMGKAKFKAKVTPAVRSGVVMAQHGWWFPEQDSHGDNPYGMKQTQLNTLVPNHLNGKLGFGAPYKNMMCDVRPLSQTYDVDMKCVYDKFGIKED